MRLAGVLVGAIMLAVGRGSGIERFGSTREAFLASLAPLIAFPLVGALLLAMAGHGGAAVVLLLLMILLQLAPPVVSHALARRWGREAEWLRYATAYNWCQWTLPLAGMVILTGVLVLTGGRIAEDRLANILVGTLGLFGLWVHYVVARHGLALGRAAAVVLVVLVNAATAALVLAPQLLRAAVS